MSIKIVFTDYYYENNQPEIEILKELGNDLEIVDLTKVKPGGIKDPSELLPYVVDADAIIAQFAVINAELIHRLEKCKVIARYAIGVDTIDLEAARERGIHVANVPDYCVEEVADTAAAHILNAARKISISRDMLMTGNFRMTELGKCYRLKNQTLGLLGFGNIARNLYGKMKAFFNKVVAYDPYFDRKEDYPEVEFVSLNDVLNQSDVVSIHVPLNKNTSGMLSYNEFCQMKPSAILVNTARGGLINEKDLVRALEENRLAYCGLDVICGEDMAHSELLHNSKITLTPHIGWNSQDSQIELQQKVARNVVSALNTGKPVYCVC